MKAKYWVFYDKELQHGYALLEDNTVVKTKDGAKTWEPVKGQSNE